MTNAEKFEKVFGLKMDSVPDDPCGIVDDKYCSNNGELYGSCNGCNLLNFWNREYVEAGEYSENVPKAFILGVIFGTVDTSDETLSLVMKELKNMEVREDE